MSAQVATAPSPQPLESGNEAEPRIDSAPAMLSLNVNQVAALEANPDTEAGLTVTDPGTRLDGGPSPFHRNLDQMVFTFSVLLVIAFTVLATGYPEALPHCYVALFAVMFITRVYFYFLMHWQFFCIDFCYFTNALLIVYLYALPDLDELFMVLFTVASGPVFLAVIPFKNRLVFHSWDKMISCFIHVVPALIVYTIRWSPNSGWSACGNAIDVEQLNETCSGPRSYIWLFGMALGFWAAHQLVYAILVQVCCLRFLRKRPDYETSYRYLMRSKGLVFRIATCCGRYQSKKWKPIGFAAVFFLYTLVTLCVPLLAFHFHWFHRVMLWVGMTLVIYFGAEFYMQIFTRSYELRQPRMFRKRNKKEQQDAKKPAGSKVAPAGTTPVDGGVTPVQVP